MRRMLVLVLALLLVSMGAAAAAPAGRVNVLCSPNQPWCDAIKVEFLRATGIQLDFVRLSSGAALARVRAERANPTFDVWFGGTGDPHFVANEEGLTEFYRPRVWNDLREELREAVRGKYIPLYAGILGWIINPTVLKEKRLEAPRVWRDLAEARHRGLVVYPNPNTSGTAYTMIATLVQIFGEEEAFNLLKRIHRNVIEYTSTGPGTPLLVARGEGAIGITFVHDAIDHQLKGFPVDYGAPRDGTGYEIGGLSLVRGAPNRANAIAFIEWALSPAAQVIAAERGESYQIPSNSKTTVPRVAPRFQDFRVINYDFPRYGSAAVRDALVKRWTSEVSTLPK